MDRKQLIARLMATFLGELDEHVRGLNADLLALEKGTDPDGPVRRERLGAIFRAAHSLKGAARSVGAAVIEEACHRLEEILGPVRDGTRAISADLFGLLFAAADAIEEAGGRLRDGRPLDDSLLAALLPRLDEAASLPGTHPDAAPAPKPSPPEIATVEPATSPPEVPPTAPDAGEPAGGRAVSVRIAAEKLDAMLTQSGELLIARRRVVARVDDLEALRESLGRWRAEWAAVERSLGRLLRAAEVGAASALSPREARALGRVGDQLRGLEKGLDRFSADLVADGRQLDLTAGRLDEEVRRARLLPFAEACEGLDRAARDVALEGGKQVELIIQGGEVGLDRSILERLRDPLLHLVRNAVGHGVEPPEVRRAAGKSAEARVTISVALRGHEVEVQVADDGRGLDLDALRGQLRRRGLAEPTDPVELARTVFLAGLSTAGIVTNISGRGVGLDVVKSRVEELHGAIEVTGEPGRCTRFTMTVPITLTTIRAIVVSAGGQLFAAPEASVRRLIRFDPADVRPIEGRPHLTPGGPPMPVASLAEVLGLPAVEPADRHARRPALVLASGDRRVAFVVDEFLSQQEVVVKGLGGRLRRLRHVSGATILPSGRVALLLNTANLVRDAGRSTPGRSPTGPLPSAAAAPVRKRLLVVDDSVTTRTLERSILEGQGYEVATAVDGEAGWRLLQERGADLLISDVEMPRMDGFALTAAVRNSTRFRNLPIILLTSLADERDRTRGIEVGADAYIVKGAFDQSDLLATIAQLL